MSMIDVEIEKLVYGGQGLAQLDGRTALIPYVLPGERLSAEIVRERGSLAHARPIAWQRQSSARLTPECPVFTECGGCHYQHIPYQEQVKFKESILRETLARIGKIEWAGEVQTLVGEPWGYRNRTQLQVRKRAKGPQTGFLAAGSHALVSTTSCPVNSPKLNEIQATITEMAGEKRFPGFLKEIEFFTNETQVQLNVRRSGKPIAKKFFDWCAERIPGLTPGEYIDYPSGGDMFRVGSRSFFQVNRFLTEALTEAATSGASGERALDLYAGVGLLTLPISRRFEHVTGVDSSGAAVRSLQFNAERAGATVRSAHLNVDKFLAGHTGRVDFVVADPPRAGLGPEVTDELLRIKPGEISLVSCDPATLARDLKELTGGGYQIGSMTLVDLFPQTYHLETVVRLMSPERQ